MEMSQIKEIAKTMSENGLTLIEITEGDSTLRVERKGTAEAACPPPPNVLPCTSINHTADILQNASTAADNAIQIKSPMVGVFFSAPSPESEPYVKVGSHVKKGDTLCVIEAMKLLNEICAERDGEVVDICAVDGQTVEFSQVLLKMI